MKKLYLDFDGVIVNTIKAIVTLYNEDFEYYKKFKPVRWFDVDTWDFKECNCATKKDIHDYFKRPRFFEELEFIEERVPFFIKSLSKLYDITIVSMGTKPNLVGKGVWIFNNFPNVSFIGIDSKKYKDKSHVDMSDGILVDDMAKILETSNAKKKILFGEMYAWNEKWIGRRARTWTELRLMLEKERGVK